VSRLKAISCPQISNGDLLARIDRANYSIVRCIKLTEAALECSDNSGPSTQNRPVIPHHPLTDIGDIFSALDQVGQNITECIKLVETTLQRSDSKELEASTTIFDHDLDHFIDALYELSPPGPNSIRAKATCTKPLSNLKEDLDYLLQLGEGEATVQREAPLFYTLQGPC
jgi:hypothetical protein